MIINITKYPIINAFYGISSKKINVINIILKNINNKICINNNLFKKDPCPGKKKKLFITLKNNSKFEFDDNSIIIISNKLLQTDNKKDEYILQTNNKKSNHILQTNNKKYDYILSTNVRDENNILEFIIYHIMIGFDKILIIDHLSKNLIINKINILPKYYKDKIQVIRFNKEGSHKLHFLNNIIIPYMKQNCNKYFIHLDGDEYINLNNNYSNISSLLKHFNYPDILNLNWLLFGSNNKEYNDNKYK